MSEKQCFKIAILFFCVILLGISCRQKNATPKKDDPKTQKLKLQDGFNAEHLYSPGENEQGSWVAMTFDDKGRMIACDQYGSLYRLTIPPVGSDTTKNKIKVEKLEIKIAGDSNKIKIGFAQGLLYAFNSLYVMVNDEGDSSLTRKSGLYRVQDSNNDDQFDKITLIKRLEGDGEHGPHSIVLSPDKKSLYVIAGNFTKIPKMDNYQGADNWKIDNILPLIRDPNGHDNTVNTHGGWIAHLDSIGAKWELVSSGFRNPFDLAFNAAGDMFTYDSDMEWDFGLPWYRPTRICHVPSGGEFGWRPGTDKWSPSYPDNLPPILNVGQGSPTSFFSGQNAHFPDKYKNSLFAFDWSFGIIYSIHLDVDGASYKAKGEEFVSGSPLSLTDGMIGPDGALYFLTGGRKLESNLYRVYYGDNKDFTKDIVAAPLLEEQKIRRKLEEYHGQPKAGAVDFAWPYLKHADRFIRYAARIAIEHQPINEWKEKGLNEKDPVILTQAMIALARSGDSTSKNQALKSLTAINYAQLSEPQQIDLLRAFELLLFRYGVPDTELKTAIANYLTPVFPAGSNELNKELSKVLIYVDAPEGVSKTIALINTAKDDSSGQMLLTKSSDLILRNPQYGLDIASMLSKVPPAQQTFYATVLSQTKTGWTPELRTKYFQWFYNAFTYKGGHSFIGFVDKARKNALKNVDKKSFALFNKMSGDSLVEKSGIYIANNVKKPKGPGKEWKIKEAVAVVDSGIINPNFENGKAMYAASLCIQCHTMKGEGGIIGPDLTQLGTRFTYKDMLEAIIEPSKNISDQYGSTIFYLKEGGSIVGRLINQDKINYTIAQNPFAPQITREILKKDVLRTQMSDVSPMLSKLINNLNSKELKDLLAYLKSGGNKDDGVFSKKK